MGAPQTKFDYPLAFCCETNTSRFCRDERLKIQHVQQRCLEQLTLQQRSRNSQQRFVREHDVAFDDRIDIACDLQRGKIIQELAFEEWVPVRAGKRGEIFKIISLKLEVL